jgi:hypothetical protein
MNIIIFVAAFAIYFIPSIVASERGHRNTGAWQRKSVVVRRSRI